MPIGYSAQQDFRKIPVKGLVIESGAAAPSSPVNGQFWYDTANNKAKVYGSGSWVGIFSGAAAGRPAGGDLSGTYPNPQIATGVIVDADLASGANINGGKIADGTIGSAELGVQVITPRELADLAVTTVKLADGAVTSLKIADGTIVIADTATSFDLGALSSAHPTTSNMNMNGRYIQNLLDPVVSNDAATKNYVDNATQGIDPKPSVKAASTANLTLSGTQTVDGVALVANDRVLVKNQTTASANGIYAVASGAWTRVVDMDAWTEVPGALTFVEQGTTQADTAWLCTSDQGGTLGTTNITWTQFGAGTTYTQGTGISIAGNVISIDDAVVATDAQVTAAVAPKADLASPTFTGDPKAPTPAANDNDTSIATTAFVTGAVSTAVAGAGTVKKFAADVGALSAGVALTVTHNLNSLDVVVEIYTKSDGTTERFAVARTGVNTITITSDIGYAANLYRVVVMS